MKGYIYYIINTSNNKKYIGLSTNIQKRFKSHKNMLANNRHHSKKLQKDYDIFGQELFIFKYCEYELENIDDLCDLERKEILKYDSFKNGYNGNAGGSLYIPRIHKIKDDEALCVLFSINNFKNKVRILADYYNLERHAISGIKEKTCWLHIQEKYNNLSDEEFNILKENVKEKYNFQEDDFCKNFEHQNKRKLIKEDCLAICCIAQKHININKSIAEALNVSHTTINRIIKGETYKEFHQCFLQLTNVQIENYNEYFYEEWNLEEIFNNRDARQLKNGKRLSQNEICYIRCARELLKTTNQKIADKFNYNESSIRDMYKGRSYKTQFAYYDSLSEYERKSYINDTKIFFNIE